MRRKRASTSSAVRLGYRCGTTKDGSQNSSYSSQNARGSPRDEHQAMWHRPRRGGCCPRSRHCPAITPRLRDAGTGDGCRKTRGRARRARSGRTSPKGPTTTGRTSTTITHARRSRVTMWQAPGHRNTARSFHHSRSATCTRVGRSKPQGSRDSYDTHDVDGGEAKRPKRGMHVSTGAVRLSDPRQRPKRQMALPT